MPLNDFYPAKFRTAVRRNWEKRNIDFILDDFIDTIPNLSEKITETTTRNGKTIKADLVVCAISQAAVTSAFDVFFRTHLGFNSWAET